MSALDFRTLLTQKLETELYGDGKERSGVINTVASGMLKDHSDYCRMTGMIRGVRVALELIDEAWQQIYNPTSEEAKKDA